MMESTPGQWHLARPEIDERLAGSLTKEHYGSTGSTGSVREVGSQQDRNFAVTSRDGSDNLLFKVHHPTTSEEEVNFQREVGERLDAAGVQTPGVVRTLDGATHVAVVDGRGDRAWARAFRLIAADSLNERAVSGELANRLGTLAGATAAALRGFEHRFAARPLQWELGNASTVVEELAGELDEPRRTVCLENARRAQSVLDELAPSLPTQVIHSDVTADNVLEDSSGELWIVDLGDACMSWRVAEFAVLAADLYGRTGDLTIVSAALTGFIQESPLSSSELEAIWPLVVLRGAVLAVSGMAQLRVDPENDYARERIEHEWSVFERSTGVSFGDAEAQLRLAGGLPHRHDAVYSSIIDGLERARVLDLGITSTLLDRGRWIDTGIEDRLARDAVADAGITYARFGETRLTRVSLDVSAPAAARARFVEVWSRPGVAIRAPFAGTVRIVNGALELSDRSVTVRFEGAIAIAREGEAVPVGGTIGAVATHTPGLGRLRLTRRIGAAPATALFVHAEEPRESEGGADPSVILGLETSPDVALELQRERTRRDRAMGGASERYYEDPPQFERGWGVHLIDTQGRAFLDMVNNVTAIGHAHPRLADAVSTQLNLLNTNSRFLYRAYADFTERLLEHAPDPSLDTVIPVNSGSEALDLALRLAQVATKRRDIVAVREGYHGWTMGADSVSTSAFDNPAALASRPDWVHLVSAPNAYRGVFRGASAGAQYADEVRATVEDLVAKGRPPAAFICEPVHGNAGGVIPPDGYLRMAYEAIRAQGGLAIADEVQVGYGRLGGAFWGSELQGAIPDIIAVAKAAGNAFPVGAVLTKRSIVDALRDEGMFFSSAGGAPASAVAGSVVLDVIRDERLQENAARVGTYLRQRLEDLASSHPIIGAVHGSGLYLGVELVRDHVTLEPARDETRWICERLLKHGVIMQATSERQNVLKVKPPLTLTMEDADAFVAALDRTLGELTPRR